MSEELKSLLEITCEELGVTPELNEITLFDPEADFPKVDEQVYKIFDQDQNGNLTILVYTIDKTIIRYTKKGGTKSSTSAINTKERLYRITRLANPAPGPDGKIRKYICPKGEPSYPFFPKQLCDKYEAGTKIDTLVITEGAKKAFKGGMHGIDIIGLGGITMWRDKATGQLHGDIIKLVKKCKPDRIIFLTDGDCLNISSKDILEQNDLYRRPHDFYSAVCTFTDLFHGEGFKDIKKYFAHQLTDEIFENEKIEAKGLDDLLCQFNGDEKKITSALLDFGKKGEISKYQNSYFIKFDISLNTGPVRKYFNLHDVNDFYNYHIQKRKQLADSEFIFNGSKYKYVDAEGKCLVLIPSDTKDYKRIGTTYYKIFLKPSLDGSKRKVLAPWDRACIKEDIRKKKIKFEDFIEHVEKLNGFTICPDHFNYQQVTDYCWNQYFELIHPIEKGETGTEDDIPVTMEFLRHIFGDGSIKWINPVATEVQDKEGIKITAIVSKEETIREVDLGLDYFKLLLCNPTQILPILCLVSDQRSTGKTTFLDWLCIIFGNNAVQVGNEDFKNEFNSHWSGKLVVGCDETKIDKLEVVEKIKRLSTSRKTTMNSKGKDQTEQDFFAKFILNSNNEHNFLPTDDEEIRFWVRKINTIKKKNTELLKDLAEEIPAFLYYLKDRQMSTPKLERHWFYTPLLKTEALTRLRESSKSGPDKEILTYMKSMFEITGDQEIRMCLKMVREVIFNKKFELNYLERILENNMGLKKHDGSGGKYYKYPVVVKKEGEDPKINYESYTGRYYTFTRAEFCKDGLSLPPENIFDNTPVTNAEPVSDDTNPFNTNYK